MIKDYFNGKAAIWDEVVAEKDASKLISMAARLKLGARATVLDIGTGTGVFVPFLWHKIGGGGKILALDVAREMLRRARAKKFDGVVAYLNADVAHIPLADTSVDSVVCYSSFPHFQDKQKAFTEIYRVLRKGGHLCICHTSCREAINNIHRVIPELVRDVIPEGPEMRTMLSVAGFVEVEVEDACESYLCQALKKG